LQDPQACDRQPPIQVQIESAWRENAAGNRSPTKKVKTEKIGMWECVYIMLLLSFCALQSFGVGKTAFSQGLLLLCIFLEKLPHSAERANQISGPKSLPWPKTHFPSLKLHLLVLDDVAMAFQFEPGQLVVLLLRRFDPKICSNFGDFPAASPATPFHSQTISEDPD